LSARTQGLVKHTKDDGRPFFAYGGDFGDLKNDKYAPSLAITSSDCHRPHEK
jgi:hypothetical protein